MWKTLQCVKTALNIFAALTVYYLCYFDVTEGMSSDQTLFRSRLCIIRMSLNACLLLLPAPVLFPVKHVVMREFLKKSTPYLTLLW